METQESRHLGSAGDTVHLDSLAASGTFFLTTFSQTSSVLSLSWIWGQTVSTVFLRSAGNKNLQLFLATGTDNTSVPSASMCMSEGKWFNYEFCLETSVLLGQLKSPKSGKWFLFCSLQMAKLTSQLSRVHSIGKKITQKHLRLLNWHWHCLPVFSRPGYEKGWHLFLRTTFQASQTLSSSYQRPPHGD